MQIKLDYSLKDRLMSFFEILKARAETKDHEENRDLIAEFIDRFLVVEMKRLTNEPEMIQETIELPDSIIEAPLQDYKAELAKNMSKLLGYDVYTRTQPMNPVVEPVYSDPISLPIGAKQYSPQPPKPDVPAGSKNGHARKKVRHLVDSERDGMSAFFSAAGGMIKDDDCVSFRAENLPEEVTIFQVCGFISQLHVAVAEGRRTVRDLPAYEEWMSTKYKDTLWAQYNKPIFKEVRAKNQAAIAAGQPAIHRVPKATSKTPAFVSFPK